MGDKLEKFFVIRFTVNTRPGLLLLWLPTTLDTTQLFLETRRAAGVECHNKVGRLWKKRNDLATITNPNIMWQAKVHTKCLSPLWRCCWQGGFNDRGRYNTIETSKQPVDEAMYFKGWVRLFHLFLDDYVVCGVLNGIFELCRSLCFIGFGNKKIIITLISVLLSFIHFHPKFTTFLLFLWLYWVSELLAQWIVGQTRAQPLGVGRALAWLILVPASVINYMELLTWWN